MSGASFFNVGASLKNYSRRLQRTKLCRSFGPKVDKLLAGLEQILPHKKVLLRAVPIKDIVRFGWQFLRLAPITRVCYLEGHASTTSGTLLPSAKAYKAWVGCIFLRCGSKFQKLLTSLAKNKTVRVFHPQSGQTACGLGTNPPLQ